MAKKKRKKFRNEWRIMTEIGEEFSLSAIKIGKLLKEHGLRKETGEASEFALHNSFSYMVTPKDGNPYYLWHGHHVSNFLISKGLVKNGMSHDESIKITQAREMARSFISGLKLEEEGSKVAYWIFDEIQGEIKKIGYDIFNKALIKEGYKGPSISEQFFTGEDV